MLILCVVVLNFCPRLY